MFIFLYSHRLKHQQGNFDFCDRHGTKSAGLDNLSQKITLQCQEFISGGVVHERSKISTESEKATEAT